MAQVLVIYYSRTGNTEAMAHEVARGAESTGATVVTRAVKDATLDDLLEADAIVLGSPTYYGTMAAEIKTLLDESVEIHGQLEGRVGGAFASAGGIGGGQQTTVMDMLRALMIHGMVIQGDPAGDHYGPVCVGRPDAAAVERCQRWGERLAALAQRLYPG